jgi:hypothetical protein
VDPEVVLAVFKTLKAKRENKQCFDCGARFVMFLLFPNCVIMSVLDTSLYYCPWCIVCTYPYVHVCIACHVSMGQYDFCCLYLSIHSCTYCMSSKHLRG